jgi:hypothetical protein
MSAPIHLTRHEMVNLLIDRDRRGATPVTLSAITPAKARVWEQGPLMKLSRVNAVMCFSYTRAMNRALSEDEMKEAFVAHKRAWGSHVSPSVVEHKGSYYLNVMVRRSLATIYLTPRAEGGWTVVPEAQIAHLLYPPDLRPVLTRDYRLDHVRAIRFNRETYVLTP